MFNSVLFRGVSVVLLCFVLTIFRTAEISSTKSRTPLTSWSLFTKNVTTHLYAKPSLLKDVAQDTDILRASAYFCHQHLSSLVNTREEVLTCYRSRTLTLFDIPIVYYVDNAHKKLDTRFGGQFCIDRTTISRVATEKSFGFDCNEFVSYLSKMFVDRPFHEK